MIVYETNNTFVTWNTHKFEKHVWALKLLKRFILKDKIRISMKANV